MLQVGSVEKSTRSGCGGTKITGSGSSSLVKTPDFEIIKSFDPEDSDPWYYAPYHDSLYLLELDEDLLLDRRRLRLLATIMNSTLFGEMLKFMSDGIFN